MTVFTRLSGDKTGALGIGDSIKFAAGTPTAAKKFDWLRIAVACVYHDYQHLVKEYKDFTGLSPTAFHEIENKAPERNFGLSEGYY